MFDTNTGHTGAQPQCHCENWLAVGPILETKGCSYPDIPEAISFFKAEVGVSGTAIPFNLASPITPADWLQLLCSQNQSDRDDDDCDQSLDNDIVGEGKARVVKEDGVLVGGVASVKRVAKLARVFRNILMVI
jgi:hypothetical protein